MPSAARPHPLKGPNRFKLGIFATNADGGDAMTRVAERWSARWPDILTATQIADRAGLEFTLPIARWRGLGGQTHVREWSFESFTWAAGLAAVTERIAIFATAHVPLIHPVHAAKALATVDHISGGRAALNIVCAWNPEEFAMFGASRVDHPYGVAAEWLEVIERAYASPEPFDFAGEFYHLESVVSRPASLQLPRPMIMNAAFGDPGRDFAASNCDLLFTTYGDAEEARHHVEDMRGRAARQGRRVGVYAVFHVVCRESEAEARDYYRHFAETRADSDAVDAQLVRNRDFADPQGDALRLYRRRLAGGTGSHPLVGTPEQIVSQLAKVSEMGFDGAALSFVNYTYELPFFCDRVLPLMQQEGLRIS